MCVFCEIVKGSIPSKKLYEDERVVAFYDITPAAEVHFLVIPKEHIIESVSGINNDNCEIVGYIFERIAYITKEQGIPSYRVINNCGEGAGQTVLHLHFHVLAGKELSARLV